MWVFLFLSSIVMCTMPLQGPSGWAAADEPTLVLDTQHFCYNPLQFEATHTLTTQLWSHDYSQLHALSEGLLEKWVSTIVPASMVDGARKQSLGMAAGCIALCRVACPGYHSCSRSFSDHSVFDKPPGESFSLHHRFGCTENGKQKITFDNITLFF